MHLRTKLTAGILLATLITFVVVGFVAIRTSKEALRDRVDARLLTEIADLDADGIAAAGADGDRPVDPSVGGEYAIVVVDSEGTTVRAMTGSPVDPDAPPSLRISDLPSPRRVVDADGADGTPYRIAAVEFGDDRWLVVGAPVADLHTLADDLTGRLLVIALVAGAALAIVAWLWIRRTTRPVEALTHRAEAIADGDEDRSLAVPTTTAELAGLTRALDAMIAGVDEALIARERSEARLREFIADASHELRTPLTSISGYLQLDLDGAFADAEQHRRSIERAAAEAARMSRLVGDLQLLAELDEATPSALWSAEDVDVASLVGEARHAAATVDATRTWLVALPPTPLVVHADPDRLRQVLDNLLANVRTHAPPGTTAVISVAMRDGTIEIDVADDGPGLTDEMERAFDRFWRHDPSRSRSSGGSGLGLSIVAAIVTAHGGTVEATRTAPHGLTIRVRLPSAAGGEPCNTPSS